MKASVPAPLVELLGYLDEVGYGDIYVPQAAVQAASAEERTRTRRERPAGASRPPQRTVVPSGKPRSASPPAEAGDSAPPAAAAPATPAAATLEQLAALAAACTACRLAEKRQNVVFGTGATDADLMFIGEGPGAEEDRQGQPFVGAAGQLLNRIIGAIKLDREQVYIANAVKCRPPGNRNPRADEILSCSGFLRRQIELVQPKVIVLLGKVAAQALLGFDEGVPLYRMRDRWHTVAGIPTRVTYHPAALLRNVSYKRPTWEDMQAVRDRLLQDA